MNKIHIEYCKQGETEIHNWYVKKNKYDIKEVITQDKKRYLKLGDMPFLNKIYKYEIRVHLENTILEIPEVVNKHNTWYGVKCGNLDLFYTRSKEDGLYNQEAEKFNKAINKEN